MYFVLLSLFFGGATLQFWAQVSSQNKSSCCNFNAGPAVCRIAVTKKVIINLKRISTRNARVWIHGPFVSYLFIVILLWHLANWLRYFYQLPIVLPSTFYHLSHGRPPRCGLMLPWNIMMPRYGVLHVSIAVFASWIRKQIQMDVLIGQFDRPSE